MDLVSPRRPTVPPASQMSLPPQRSGHPQRTLSVRRDPLIAVGERTEHNELVSDSVAWKQFTVNLVGRNIEN